MSFVLISPDGQKVKEFLEPLSNEDLDAMTTKKYIAKTGHKVGDSVFSSRKTAMKRERGMLMQKGHGKPGKGPKEGGLKKVMQDILKQFKEKGIGPKAFASLAGLSPSAVQSFLYGQKKIIRTDTALRIARAAGVSPDMFRPYLSSINTGAPIRNKPSSHRSNRGETYTIPCPHCEGKGNIQVRRV